MTNARGEQTWVFRTGDEVTIRLRVEADDDYPTPVFAVDIHRYDGVFIGSVNNCDTNPARLPVKRGDNLVELHIPKFELSHNVYFLSVKAYTETGEPDWSDPADIHYQMYQFNVLTEGVIHGLMRFEAEWSRA
jgi:hypothetical protein